MTNLLLGYSQIGFLSATELSTPTLDGDYSANYVARNLYGGGRPETVRLASAATSSTWSWDHGALLSPDFLFLARADLIRRKDTAASSWLLEADDDGSFFIVDGDTGTFNLGDLKGPRNEDLIVELAKLPDHQYFRFTVSTTASFKHEYSKMLMGTWLDLGRDPIYPARFTRDATVPMPRAVPWSFSLEWRGVTDATVQTLSDRVLKYRDVNPVILYDPLDVVLPNTIRVIHAFITDAVVTPEWPGTNRVQMSFLEAI